MDRHAGPPEREMVYCHQCEEEWYRDEHGLVCPACQSDFTEIIEPHHDPRDGDVLPSDESDTHEWYAPDPDEEDIEHFARRHGAEGQNTDEHGTRGFIYGGMQDRQQPQLGQPGGLLGLIGTMFGGQQPQQQQQPTPAPQQGQNMWNHGGETFRSVSTTPGGGHTTVHHTSGRNFSFTVTTSTNTNLHPRNANSPQPFQQQPATMEQLLLGQMFMNIGAMPGHGMGGGARMGPGGPMFMEIGGGPREFGAGPGRGGLPFGDLLSLLMPPGGVHGDAVYSQEALDRIITQLMEQHQTGNAPGPASDDAINSLPTRGITKADQGDSGKAECSICMDEAELGAKVTVLPCDHWFHYECIKAWLSEHDTCPHCRRGIMPKDEPNTNRPRQPSQAPLNDMHSPEYHMPRNPGEFPFESPGSPGSSRSGPARSPGSSGSGLFERMRGAFGGGGNNNSNRDGSRPQ